MRPNGTYDFVGDYGIEPDTYDFDPKDWGPRDWPGEAGVRLMDLLHDLGIGTPYENQVIGRVPVRERGGR